VQDELAIERDHRQQAEQERDEAIVARQEGRGAAAGSGGPHDAEGRSQAAQRPMHDPQTTRTTRKTMPVTEPSPGGDEVKPVRRRGWPAKSDLSAAEIVEWWKPGWQKQFR
jgi:hypothetical protein